MKFPTLFKRETSPQRVLRAELQKVSHMPFIPSVVRRSPAQDLIQAYGMWAHRAVTIKASVAAAIPFRLFAIGDKATVNKIKCYGPKPLSHRTKQYLSGRMECKQLGTVNKALQGNIDELTEITDHPILDLMDDVNGWDEGYSAREGWYTDLDVYGEHFSHKVFAGKFPVQLWRMDPVLMKVIPSTTDFVKGFKYGNGPDAIELTPDDVLWFKLNDPANQWGGYSWIAAWLTTIKASLAIAEFQLWLMEHGGQPDILITDESGMKESQKREFKRSWQSQFGKLWGRGRQAIAVLSGKLKVEKLGQSNRELEFNKSEEAKRDQIAAASGVPVAFFHSDKIAANSREAMNQFKLLTIWPMIQRIQDRLNQRFVAEYWSDKLLLIADNPIEEDRELRIREREANLRSGSSVDEERVEDGKEPWGTPDSMAAMIAGELKPLEGLMESAELGRQGQLASNEMTLNPPEKPEPDKREDDKDEKQPQGFTIKDMMALVKGVSKPIERPMQIPAEARATAMIGLKMLTEGKQAAPIVNIAPAEITINVPEMQPIIQVDAPDIKAPIINVEAAKAAVVVNVPKSNPPDVTVINQPPALKNMDVLHDGKGRISGVRLNG